MNHPFTYKGETLARKRQKLKLTRHEVAQTLTLSIDQIISLEKNLDYGFATAHFRLLAIKRYAGLLNLDLKKVIIQENAQANVPKPISEPLQNTKISFKWIVMLLGVFIIFFFMFNTPDEYHDDENIIANLEKEIIDNSNVALNESYEPDDLPFSTKSESDKALAQPKPDIANQPVAEISDDNEVIDLDFICTINSTAVREFSTTNPEKPASYFHLVALEAQTICTVDSLGNKKTYRLKEGGKLTHRGEPPFKIQLDPNKSRLYFQGWIVHLQPQDYFIQLNPKEVINAAN